MLKYGMAKQHAVNKTNQLQNASGPKQSEDKAPGKRQTDRFKIPINYNSSEDAGQIQTTSEMDPPATSNWIAVAGCHSIGQWKNTFPNTDRTCVKSLSRRCLEQHWGFANYIVRFPMRNPDSASYSIVRLLTRVRSFHRDHSRWSYTMFPVIFNNFCPGTANMFCPTRAQLCWQVYSIWGAGLIHHGSESFTIFVKSTMQMFWKFNL